MEGVLKSDIFFFITAVVVVAIGVCAVVAFIYLIKILSDFKQVSKTVKKETAALAEDLDQVHANVRNGRVAAGLFGFVRSLFRRKRRK